MSMGGGRMRLRKLPIVLCSKRVLLFTLVLAAAWVVPLRPALPAQECLSASGEAAVTACRAALRETPGDLQVRLALGDAYMSLRRYAEAVVVLREAFEYAPGDDTVKRRLALAESYLEEQRWIEEREQSASASQATGKSDAKIRLSIIRCNKLQGEGALNACNEGLQLSPGNQDLLVGRGNAWLALDQPAKAAADYQAALDAAPGDRNAAKQLRLASTKRKIKAAQCLQGDGPQALEACNAALLTGADDEFAIRKQQARLLHGLEREDEALRAYQAAARLNPADGEVKRALAAWSPEPRPAPPTPPSEAVGEPQQATPPAAARQQPAVKKPVPLKPVATTPPPAKEKPQETQPKSDPVPTKMAAAAVAPRPANPEPDRQLESPVAAPATASPRRFSNRPSQPGITH